MATKSANDALVRLFDDLVRCETRLYNAIGESLRQEHGIATSQYEFLRYFRDHPGSRIADVAANFAAGIGAISKGVDRLEARGWVARHPNPADGRSSLVSLTSAGAVLVADADSTFRDRLAELMTADLAAADVEATGRVLASLRSALERDRVGLPVG
ncbi:MarR family transcriptional regulator [Leifsonia shinshuensis]|uniref:MarR family winged helix-turn-helix transcriptional regulator n=1 Tax=Leifsonia shinshuensis TaxID=150026 RepID=UPI00285E4226|nr:MarR family transcriptional regulator [Leifsonia shinshuensis]MDR6971705.1 DNA-binding MarR family transcriptional regulator [Leifsonia shinshuensis]